MARARSLPGALPAPSPASPTRLYRSRPGRPGDRGGYPGIDFSRRPLELKAPIPCKSIERVDIKIISSTYQDHALAQKSTRVLTSDTRAPICGWHDLHGSTGARSFWPILAPVMLHTLSFQPTRSQPTHLHERSNNITADCRHHGVPTAAHAHPTPTMHAAVHMCRARLRPLPLACPVLEAHRNGPFGPSGAARAPLVDTITTRISAAL